MPKQKVFLSYSKTSQSASDVINGIVGNNIPIVRDFQPDHNDYDLVRWGTYKKVRFEPSRTLNDRDAVILASNKIKCLTRLQENGISVVPFTTSKSTAISWLKDMSMVVARKDAHSTKGKGIKFFTHPQQIQDESFEFYTQYVPHEREYRYHIFKDQVIDVSRKIVNKEYEGTPHPFVWNFNNGYRFKRCSVEVINKYRSEVTEECKKAITTLGLDFGAVDVIWAYDPNELDELKYKPYILEVNTAPGVEGSVLDKYVNCITQWLKDE